MKVMEASVCFQKKAFSLSENILKLNSFLVSLGRSVYIFAAINSADSL